MSSFIKKKRMKLPMIKQEQFSECGYACVAMIANYHGHELDLFSLRTIEAPSMNGCTLLDLVRLFGKLGLTGRALRVEPHDLKYVSFPALLHWNLNHFVVLKSVHRKYVIIHDPAGGVRQVSWQELSHSFTGIVLEVEKTETFHPMQAQNKLTLWDLFTKVSGLKSSLVLLLCFSLAIELFFLINPLLIQYVTDGVISSNSTNNLYVLIAGFLLLTLCHTFIESIRSHFVVHLSTRMAEYFSSGVMRHLLQLPYRYFEQRHQGDILSRFHALHEIQNKMTTDSMTTLLDGFVMVLAVVIMLIYNVTLTLIVLLALSLYSTIRLTAYRHHKRQMELSISEHAQLSSKFLEIIRSMISIKLYSKEQSIFHRWQNHWIKAMNADIKISRVGIMYTLANLMVFNIEHIGVIAMGALLVMHHQFSVGMLMAFLAYRQSLVNKSSSFIQKIFDYKLLSVQLDRVSDILLHPVETHNSLNGVNKEIKGSINVNRLSYRYAEHQPWVLKEISFHIHPGEKVAITGASGIGKTTLLKILLGLIPPSEGEILIDDIPLFATGMKNYRNQCASVMQEDALMSGSLLDNITFLETNMDIGRVYEVAKMAQIHEDILKMPMGYETVLGDLGNTLSGGQKQRVLIARALYKNPKILFLDEATSHLDVTTEIKINAVLKGLKITQVIIAHREESIKMADRVVHLG